MKDSSISNHMQTIAGHRAAIAEGEENIIDIKCATNLMSAAIGLRNPYTKNHSDHVAEITLNIAESGFSDQFVNLDTVRMAAIIHDVGKIAVDEFILNKPTLLTEAEFEMIKFHTFLGRKLIADFDYNPMLNDAILSHHENYDGTGYPNGLKGDEIPLIARIIRVADYFDALTSSRPYRSTLQVDDAINIMRKNMHCFDPDVFKVFINNKQWLTRFCT
ncbi:MAG: HD domain-containing protein [Deltaproteobacteria bacterium]|nr:HD domain-containing protein [Deltaproteobacteria bacterium]